jgi:hypothetical protein
MMRTSVVIFALTLGVWTFFYIYTPEAPLTVRDTTVVVGICAALVLAVKWIGRRLWIWGRRDGHES